MKRIAWIEPEGIDGALAAGAQPGALFKAGGVDVADRLKEGIDAPEALVNLRGLRELDFLKAEMGTLAIGPLVTLARLAADPTVRSTARALADAALQAATPQIRNMATLGGNIAQRPRCWYFRNQLFHCKKKGGTTCYAQEGEHQFHAVWDNDVCAAVSGSATATALVALGAAATVKSTQGERTMPVEDLFVRASEDCEKEHKLKPGELIVAVRVPQRKHSAYIKLMEKQSFDWPLVEAAVALTLEGAFVREARVVLGAVAHTPRRALEVEKRITGQTLDDLVLDEAVKLAAQGATPLPRNKYKLPLVEVAVRRALVAAREGA